MSQTPEQKKALYDLETRVAGEMFGTLQCDLCLHLRPPRSCAAFPDGIPIDVMVGNIDHTKPVLGDHGIRFRSKEEREYVVVQSGQATPEHFYGIGHLSPTCSLCVRLKRGADRPQCEAFDTIPMAIWVGANDHTAPYDGDHGLRFKPAG